MSGLVLYTSDDGRTRLDSRIDGQTAWLTHLEIAEIFQTTKQNVSLHRRNIFDDGELTPEATVKESLTTAADGKRYKTKLYNLDLTLDYWRGSVDRMLAANDQPLLDGPGSVSHEAMKAIANDRYTDFDAKRRKQEAMEADAEDLKAIEDLEKELKRKGGKA